eukprot:TRINITY_DN22820_c0_g1_i1.p1 TRINITY_DN22820_c0_g1~~TRINITY_DN22820_c0_g1_i1.p1  ORF type:complete len:470 (+),score=96.10 TRINITY_DN22820_c0_g1_i1:660-2069(+)
MPRGGKSKTKAGKRRRKEETSSSSEEVPAKKTKKRRRSKSTKRKKPKKSRKTPDVHEEMMKQWMMHQQMMQQHMMMQHQHWAASMGMMPPPGMPALAPGANPPLAAANQPAPKKNEKEKAASSSSSNSGSDSESSGSVDNGRARAAAAAAAALSLGTAPSGSAEKSEPQEEAEQPSAEPKAEATASTEGQADAEDDGKARKRRRGWDIEAVTLAGTTEESRPDQLDDGIWEEPRSKTGMKLIGEMAPPTLQWEYSLFDESRRSFVGYLKRALTPEVSRKFFQLAHTGTTWFQPASSSGPIPRKTAWLVNGRNCRCEYRYGRIEVQPQLFPQWIIDLMQWIMPCCGINDVASWPNSCNLNLYDEGNMSCGWHADDEDLFQGKHKDTRIISLSLGAPRLFEVRLNWPDFENPSQCSVVLGDGDLCTMEGMLQKHAQHRVPREDHVRTARINLTWRWIEQHSPRCPARLGNA